MKNRLIVSVTVLAMLTVFSAGVFAKRQQSAPTAQNASSPATSTSTRPDFTGLWMVHKNLYSLASDEGVMTEWGQAKFKTNVSDGDPSLRCFPMGVPHIMAVPFPLEIVQTPARLIMLFEFDHHVREIFTDGREHPKDVDPKWMGHSTGKWDGDTRVVDTVGLNDKVWIDLLGHPQSEQLHVVERLRLSDPETLEDNITINDPKSYTRPLTTKVVYTLRKGWNLEEFSCAENNPRISGAKKK